MSHWSYAEMNAAFGLSDVIHLSCRLKIYRRFCLIQRFQNRKAKITLGWSENGSLKGNHFPRTAKVAIKNYQTNNY